jgi:PBP1b-binding outer membrane lipoprotein LpoB
MKNIIFLSLCIAFLFSCNSNEDAKETIAKKQDSVKVNVKKIPLQKLRQQMHLIQITHLITLLLF